MNHLITRVGRNCRNTFSRFIQSNYQMNNNQSRLYSSGSAEDQTDGEKKICSVLKAKFPSSNNVQVRDISGGCGSMYEVYIESTDFKGKRIVAQHKMVTEALAEEIKEMHGLRINTAVPDS